MSITVPTTDTIGDQLADLAPGDLDLAWCLIRRVFPDLSAEWCEERSAWLFVLPYHGQDKAPRRKLRLVQDQAA